MSAVELIELVLANITLCHLFRAFAAFMNGMAIQYMSDVQHCSVESCYDWPENETKLAIAFDVLLNVTEVLVMFLFREVEGRDRVFFLNPSPGFWLF